MSVNSALLANNPVWTSETVTLVLPPIGVWPGPAVPPATNPPFPIGLPLATISAWRSVTISNVGPVNVWLGGYFEAAILLQPGAAITIPLGSGAEIFMHDLSDPGVGTIGMVGHV